MAEFPALQLWTDAYLGDTTHLTCMEHGAYLLLLITAWRTRDICLPDDDRLLARYAQCTKGQWAKIRPILEPFYTIENGVWKQSRLIDEAKAVRSKREMQAQNGRASALKRKDRHSTERIATDEPNDDQSSTPTATATATIPLSKDNGVEPDSDKQFWDMAKGYLGKSSGGLINGWLRDFGKVETANAITAAQLERAIDPVAFIKGRFRTRGREPAGAFQV